MSSADRWLLAAALLLMYPSGSQGQTAATASTLKAAFLYNFAKFTAWPAEALAPGQPLVLCVIGDLAVADALEQTIRGRTTDGHDLAVHVVKPDGAVRACHLLYAAGLDATQRTLLGEALNGVPVLTVGNGDSIGEWNAVAHLIQQNDRMRFAINVAAAERAGLQISSKLLSLATIVGEKPYGRQ